MKTNIRYFAYAACAAAALSLTACGNSGGNAGNSAAASDESAIQAQADTAAADSRGYIVKVGDSVPQFDLQLPDGTVIPVDQLKGKVVMLQFTASWCGVCRKEMPFIESDIWLKLKENPDFALYGIDFKEDVEKIKDFAASIPVTYPIALDPEGEIFNLFCAPDAGVTRNVILDREGRIIMLTRLYDPEEFARMVETINAELAR